MMSFLTALMARFAVLPGLLMAIPSILAGALRFFATPIGQVAAVALVAVTAFAWGDIHRGRADAAWHHAEVQRLSDASQARQRERDTEAKAEATRDVTARLLNLEKFNTDLQQKVDGYEKELAKAGGDVCRLSPRDIDRLRKL